MTTAACEDPDPCARPAAWSVTGSCPTCGDPILNRPRWRLCNTHRELLLISLTVSADHLYGDATGQQIIDALEWTEL